MTSNLTLGAPQVLDNSPASINLALQQILEQLDGLKGLRGRVELWDRARVDDPTLTQDAETLGSRGTALTAKNALVAPPEVEDAGALGTVPGRWAAFDHTHSGVNRSDAQTVGGAKTFSAKLTTSGELQIGGALNHDGTTVGLFNVAPVAQSTGWSVTNVTTDKVYNADATTLDEVADVLGTLITYLISLGILAA